MKKVRFLDEPKESKEPKPIQITHALNHDHGWINEEINIQAEDELIYLGNCRKDGDMFMCKSDGFISIWKGHLNDGVY